MKFVLNRRAALFERSKLAIKTTIKKKDSQKSSATQVFVLHVAQV